MTERHWSDDDLLNSVYGIGPADSHPDQCPDCRARLHQIERRRMDVIAEPNLSYSRLAAQRRAIYSRIDDPVSPKPLFRLAPFAAAAATIVCAVLLTRPAPQPEPSPSVAAGDSHLYTDIYLDIATDMPRAAAPIRGLFEE